MALRAGHFSVHVVAAALTAAALGAAVAGAANPGDPCPKEGATADLAGGKIQCVGGKWQPLSGARPAPAGGAGTPATSPGSPSAGSASSTVKSAAIFTRVGLALTPDTFFSAGKQVADVTAVRLADGRVRLYAFVSPDGIRSAISTDASGTSFTAEPGRRIMWAPGGQPRAYVLDDGRTRLFYLDGGNIKSAISSDGLAFADEGVRLTSAQAGFEPGGFSVVKTADGYRGYFSNLAKPGVRADRVARTATSPDMLAWTVGPVITGASGSITDGASHPFAVTDGKTIALYYNGDRGSFYGALRSTSTDGVTFGNERAILATAGDPQLLAVAGGTTLLYYGELVDQAHGFGIAVARTAADPVSGEGAAAGTTAAQAAGAKKPAAKAAPGKKTPAKKPVPPKRK